MTTLISPEDFCLKHTYPQENLNYYIEIGEVVVDEQGKLDEEATVKTLKSSDGDFKPVDSGGDTLTIEHIEYLTFNAKRKQEEARAELLNMQLKQSRYELVPINMVKEAIATIASGLSQQVNNMTSKLSQKLARTKSPAAVKKILDDELKVFLEDLKGVNPVDLAQQAEAMSGAEKSRSTSKFKRRTQN